MRQVMYPVLALLLALAGCVGVLLFRQTLWPDVSAKIGVGTVVSNTKLTDKKSPLGSASRTATGRPARHEASEIELPAAKPTSRHMNYPFPVSEEVKVGLSKSAVVATFGPPEATATGADHGRLQERLVYVDKSTGQKTIIAAVDGKVVGAQTFVK
jgi:hypothetical protein